MIILRLLKTTLLDYPEHIACILFTGGCNLRCPYCQNTELICLIRELTKRGYNVASVKHSHHNIEMDKPNTDTWRHKQAGANLVVGIGSTTFFNVKEEYDLNRILYLLKHLGNFDFVIIKGFIKYNYPKIATSPEIVDEYTIKEVNPFEANYEMINEQPE